MFGRNKLAVVLAEFLGTGVLALVVLSVQRSNIGIPYFIAIAAGLAVAGLSMIFSEVSGAHFNPAITIGRWSARKIKTLDAALYVVAQLLGGWAAYGIYRYFINTGWPQVAGHFTARVMIAEAVGAFVFAIVWAAVSARKLSASVVGFGLTLGVLVASSASAALLNPAVALADRVWNVWGALGWGTYVLGPIVGAVVAFNLYELVFADGKSGVARANVSRPAPTVEEPETVSPVTKAAATTARKTTAKKKPVRKSKKA